MNLRIQYWYWDADEPVQVQTTLANIVAWERRYKRKASQMAQEAGVEDLAYLAWEAAKTAKVVVPVSFDDFVAKLRTLEIVEDEPANPTHAAPGAAH